MNRNLRHIDIRMNFDRLGKYELDRRRATQLRGMRGLRHWRSVAQGMLWLLAEKNGER